MTGPEQQTPNVTSMETLIIEDDSRSIQLASSVLKQLGVTQVQAISDVSIGLEHLRAAVEGRAAMPDLLILDLEFNMESGFEVLRYWKATPKLRNMRVIVWTVMGDLEQQISRLFGVESVVDKHLGAAELEKALRRAMGLARTA